MNHARYGGEDASNHPVSRNGLLESTAARCYVCLGWSDLVRHPEGFICRKGCGA